MEKREREATLLQAAYEGNLRLLKKMARALDKGQGEAAVLAAVATNDHHGNRALHRAAMEGRVDVLRYLVEELRLDVNQLNTKGHTPLYFSSLAGKVFAARYLLDHGADPLVFSHISTLHVAAAQGHDEIVELLLSKGIDVDLHCTGGTPLHAAAIHGQASTMKILLEHHADPNKVVNFDGTPLVMAIYVGSLECVKLLIKSGADVNFRDSNGVTVVIRAVNHGSSDIMKCLLEAGANPNIPDGFGKTPIEYAALRGERETVEMLFPLTSPISTRLDWSIDGIISHVKTFGVETRHDLLVKKSAELKLQAREAFERKEYMIAAQNYTNAMELSPSANQYATLLANRSLCLLRMECGKQALADAKMCRMLRPQWEKGCYRQGAACMFLKDYEQACEAFTDGLKLDPTNVEIQNALREASQALKNARCTEKER